VEQRGSRGCSDLYLPEAAQTPHAADRSAPG